MKMTLVYSSNLRLTYVCFIRFENTQFDLSLVVKKTGFFEICENKDADQLRGNREADQRLCFRRYTDSTIPLLTKYEFSSL